MRHIIRNKLRGVLLLTLWLVSIWACNNPSLYINPEGTFVTTNDTIMQGDDIIGRFGEIQIKNLSKNRLVINFTVCNGAPSYNSGSFVDTLEYKNNEIIYTNPLNDPSCKIRFVIHENGISVEEQTEQSNFGCGFGHSVYSDGYFKKISKETPLLREFLSNKII